MQDIVALFIIIVVSYLILSYLFDNKKEHYITTIVGSNNIAIPAYHISNLFDTETEELNVLFKKEFKDDDMEPVSFKEHNPYIPFPFETPFKKFIIDYLKTNLDKFKGHKLEITSDINKLYYKDIGNDRIFIFNVNIVDNTKFMTRNIRIKLKIKDIIKFIRDDTDYTGYVGMNKKQEAAINYRTNIPAQTTINSIELLSIRLDKNNYARFELNGVDSLRPDYYQIKNVLGLMDPFLTSGKDMIVTNKMKKDFIKDIEEHTKLLNSLSK
jgi:hypothetical protein